MKPLMLAALLTVLPSALQAQAVQPTPIDSADARLELVRPLADHLVAGDVDAALALARRVRPDAAEQEQLVAQLRTVADEFGGGRYTVEGFLNGRGRDVIVQLRSKDDGAAAAFAVVLEPDTDALSGFAQVRIAG